ncbi:hypothetical protein Tco_1258086, partial [Tanacetum coccineum]
MYREWFTYNSPKLCEEDGMMSSERNDNPNMIYGLMLALSPDGIQNKFVSRAP